MCAVILAAALAASLGAACADDPESFAFQAEPGRYEFAQFVEYELDKVEPDGTHVYEFGTDPDDLAGWADRWHPGDHDNVERGSDTGVSLKRYGDTYDIDWRVCHGERGYHVCEKWVQERYQSGEPGLEGDPVIWMATGLELQWLDPESLVFYHVRETRCDDPDPETPPDCTILQRGRTHTAALFVRVSEIIYPDWLEPE